MSPTHLHDVDGLFELFGIFGDDFSIGFDGLAISKVVVEVF
jgi:hypothetical protein